MRCSGIYLVWFPDHSSARRKEKSLVNNLVLA